MVYEKPGYTVRLVLSKDIRMLYAKLLNERTVRQRGRKGKGWWKTQILLNKIRGEQRGQTPKKIGMVKN